MRERKPVRWFDSVLLVIAALALPAFADEQKVLQLGSEPCKENETAMVTIGDRPVLKFVCFFGRWRMFAADEAAKPAAQAKPPVRPPAPQPTPAPAPSN